MFPRVTAVLVAHHGGDHLRRSLEAIRAQHRAPDALVVVLTEADAEAREMAAASSPTHIVELSQRRSFGEAVRAAERVLDEPGSDADALWLLAEDTAPAPEALERLVATLETAKSVAVAGPKLREWDEPDRIASFGRTITRFGRSVALVSDELDQGQHDGLSDVLGLDPAAILVRHTVWRALDGFDPALPTVDDALDFSIRARLAGHRVSVVPDAHVVFAAVGVVGPPADARARASRRRLRAARAAVLHRRLVYAPAVVVPVHWLTFLPLAILRSIRLLLVKSPGAIIGEFTAAFATMFSGMRVARARRQLKAARTTGWSAIAPLRMPPDEVRRRRQHAAEARRARARGRKEELQFLGTGGGWVLLGSIVASVALFSWLLSASGLRGGGILPLSNGLDALWRNAAYGWRDIGAGFVGAADPFAGLLAVLGSLTFWAPSFALVLVWLLAVPVATLGAWFAASRLTERGSVRAVAALVWGLAPPLLVALADGRPGAVIAHMVLGWLAFAVFGAATSWAAAATASLLFAVVVAAAPSLAPALLVAWIVGLVVSGRAAVRLAGLPLPALVLFAPLVITQFGRGTPLALIADPGLPLDSAVPTPWQLALGFPGAPWGDWAAFLGDGSAVDPKLLLTLLVVPLIIAALAAVLAPGIRSAVLSLGVALLGFATAVAAAVVAVAVAGPQAVQVWTGAGLSLMWLGLTLAAVIALSALRRGGAVLAWLVAAAVVAAVLPTGLGIATASTEIAPAADRTLPAFVGAEAAADPRVTTLRIQPEADGSIRATLERGAGTTLDEQSTLDQTLEEMSESEEELAEVAGNLASRSGFDPDAAIREFGVSFVLLAPPAGDDRAGAATTDRARSALDGNAALTAVGETDFGTLWRFTAAEPDAPAAQIPPAAGLTGVITAVQLIVLGAVLLLSIPTGIGREADRRPAERRPRKQRGSSTGRAAVETADAADATDAADAPDAADPEASPPAEEPPADDPPTDEPATDEPATDEPAAEPTERSSETKGDDDAR
ncbi:glycosyltransferase family 2 protein [Agromyces laixinhei]|uniref:glycosyltransferase family 2 protein n=1 Tax=Agromyces laixinhei TaxID=2585717 RepID=UPI0018DDB0B5|nr:glycosyltransferase [Agromyces laixinhei]